MLAIDIGTPLAVAGDVRLLALIATLLASGSPVWAEPLWQAELRAGYGIAVSGNGLEMSRRPTPLTLAALAIFAFNETPPLAGYGGIVVETLDRNAAGTMFGIQLTPHGNPLRLSAGGTWLVAPYTLWGATASLGICVHPTEHFGLCSDVQLTAYLGGNDLAEGRTLSQAQIALGMVFDAY